MRQPKKRSTGTGRAVVALGAALGVLFMVAFLSATAFACPVCQSATGTAVRSAIFDASFGGHLLVTIVPFAVVAALVNIIPRLLPPQSRQESEAPSSKEEDWQ